MSHGKCNLRESSNEMNYWRNLQRGEEGSKGVRGIVWIFCSSSIMNQHNSNHKVYSDGIFFLLKKYQRKNL